MTEERSCEEAFAEWYDFPPGVSAWGLDDLRAAFAAGWARTPTLPAGIAERVRDIANSLDPHGYDLLHDLADEIEAAGDRPPAEREES